jgi:hypothetical protein
MLITDQIKANTILDAAAVIILRDRYVKLQVSNIKMKEAGEDGKRRRENCSVPPSFVCFCMHEERLSDITVLYLRNAVGVSRLSNKSCSFMSASK